LAPARATEFSPLARLWRARIFASTWLLYAGFYLCRKNYAVAQPVFMHEFGWNEAGVGMIVTAYLTVYAIGQFLNGVMGDRFSARRIVAAGLVLAILANVAFGFAASIGVMALLWGLNGFGQSSGWPGVVKTLSAWFGVRERGKVMAWWSTCYQIGEVVSSALAAWLISPGVVAAFNGVLHATGRTWQYAFWIPALLLAAVGAVFLWGQRNSPEAAGIRLLANPERAPRLAKPRSGRVERVSGSDRRENADGVVLEVLGDRYIWTLGAVYFCVKFVRYAFMFWLSTYLVTVLGFRPDKAGYMNVVLPLAGFLGAVAGGYASDYLFGSRRAPVSTIMLVGLAVAVFFYSRVAADPWLGPLGLGAIGFMTFGPDTLVSATSAMDFGSRRGASTAAGFINGMGSIGAAIQGVLVGYLAHRAGWQAVFSLLIVLSLVAAAIQATMWNARGKN
jgi:OPA family sugar phosphate sensor protein UhpC-like MFS transporter